MVFKVVWCKLKFPVIKAFNFFHKKTLCKLHLFNQYLNTKRRKALPVLKKFETGLLVMHLCRLLSTAIGNRLETVIDCMITRSKSVFIKGQQIMDVTRLVYDAMSIVEQVKN